MKLYCDTRLSLNYMYKDCEYITLWNVICQDMFFSEKLFVRNGFQFHCCRTRFQSLSPAEGQVVWDGMMHCTVWYGIVCLGMVWCMVAVLKCEMAAAQKKVFSHPGAWKDSEIITGRPLLVNCGAGRARTAHNKILLSFAYRRVTLGISVLEGRKYLYTLHSVLV